MGDLLPVSEGGAMLRGAACSAAFTGGALVIGGAKGGAGSTGTPISGPVLACGTSAATGRGTDLCTGSGAARPIAVLRTEGGAGIGRGAGCHSDGEDGAGSTRSISLVRTEGGAGIGRGAGC